MTPNTQIPEHLAGMACLDPKPCNKADLMLSDTDLERNCPLDIGRHSLEPKHDLGLLSSVPLEITSDILIQLDIRTLMAFRRVSQRAMQVVDSIPLFHALTTQALSTFRAIISVEADVDITCEDLYRTLSSSECVQCHSFGGLIYVLDCTRICSHCTMEIEFDSHNDKAPILLSNSALGFGLEPSTYMSLRRIRTVPGKYRNGDDFATERHMLTTVGAARRASILLHGTDKAASKENIPYDERLESHVKSYMATARAPVIKSLAATAVPEWALYCKGCREWNYTQYPEYEYNVEDFEEHLRADGPVVNGKHTEKWWRS